jgi:Cytochrome P450
MPSYRNSFGFSFGSGHRSCLGRKFSEVESVAMLVHLLRNYSVHLVPTSADGSVDVATARERFSQASSGITLTPVDIPLIFRRRTHN